MNFDEILDQFLEAISNFAENVPDGEEIMDAVHGKLHTLFETFFNSDIVPTDEQTELIVNKLSETLNEPVDSVKNAIDAIKNTTDEYVDKTLPDVTDIDTKTWDSSFQGICWDECVVSLGTGSKRYYGGYYG